MYKLVINYLLANSGKLPNNETWYDVGIKFGIEAPNKKRAKRDKKYKRKAIGRIALRYWESYLKQQKKLKLSKQVYKNGKLLFETFKDKPEENSFIDYSQFEIDRVTTNPYGGAWYKMKKKEIFYTEEHLQKLRDLLTKEITPVKYNKPFSSNEKGLFIYGSDKHIGALTKENSIYTNKYDKKEMYRRIVEETLKDIYQKVEIYGTFESLFIMDFGDALDGFNEKTTSGLRGTSSHTLPQQLNNREQHDYYIELHKELFDNIMQEQFAQNIFFIATSNSNHGGDFEYGAMKHLETYLNLKYPDIKTYVSYKPLNHFTYGKHAIIFGHGKDDEDMKRGLPLTLNPKVENILADYIRINKLEDYYITVISGDLHQSAETYAKNFRYRKVLSQYGSSKWMHTNFGSGNPGLSTEIFNKNDKYVIKIDNYFDINNQSNTGIEF